MCNMCSIVYCSIVYSTCIVLCTVHVYCTQYYTYCTQYSMYCTQYSMYCTQYSMCTVHMEYCVQYMCSIVYSTCVVLCTVKSLPFYWPQPHLPLIQLSACAYFKACHSTNCRHPFYIFTTAIPFCFNSCANLLTTDSLSTYHKCMCTLIHYNLPYTFLLTTALCGCMLKVYHLQIAAALLITAYLFTNYRLPFLQPYLSQL